ncbi:MAG: helix-hairpin-helix domain-containing protein [Clostridia bacterium]|nr:helix-hairpin-helix domain-containing protein [Clostridia bacterium]
MTINILGLRFFMGKSMLIASIAILGVLMCIGGFAISGHNEGIIIQKAAADIKELRQTSSAPQDTKADGAQCQPESSRTEEIQVYVVGCVKAPGLVSLQKGALIDDAIKAAGGLTDQADAESINLAFKLKENTMLRVKAKSKPSTAAVRSNAEAAKTQQASLAGNGIEVVANSGGAVIDEQCEPGKGEKININTATAKQLDSLPGIGMETGGDIIAFREKNGPFKKIEDITKVPGIKSSKFNKIKEFITVD